MWTNAARAASSVTVKTSCGNCGRPVDRAECKRAKQRDLDKARREQNKPSDTVYATHCAEIVFDPGRDPLAAGLQLSSYEIKHMLRFGAFTPGTVIIHDGAREVVMKDPKGALYLRGIE